MFKQKDKKEITELTIISEGIKFDEDGISGSGSLRIDGEVYSNIKIEGNITIGQTGYLKGDISVGSALLAGKVDGNIASKQSVHLTSTSSITGNITATSLVIDEGAAFSGNCKMTNSNESNNNLIYKKNNDSNLTFDKI